jgi:hypothetical protein
VVRDQVAARNGGHLRAGRRPAPVAYRARISGPRLGRIADYAPGEAVSPQKSPGGQAAASG